MTTQSDSPSPMRSRLRILDEDEIRDPELRSIIDRSKQLMAPKPEWYRLCGAAPEMAKAWHAYWEATFRGGVVEHETKELMRLAMVTLIDCAYCSTQRSVQALEGGLEEEVVAQACGVSLGALSPRAAAAVRFGRATVANDPSTEPELFDGVYDQLKSVFSDGEIVELVCLAMMVMGAKVAATLELPSNAVPNALAAPQQASSRVDSP
jgi:alkylhydroperoxidase/carboxymuconolactone decarboxylase family protein YurZ